MVVVIFIFFVHCGCPCVWFRIYCLLVLIFIFLFVCLLLSYYVILLLSFYYPSTITACSVIRLLLCSPFLLLLCSPFLYSPFCYPSIIAATFSVSIICFASPPPSVINLPLHPTFIPPDCCFIWFIPRRFILLLFLHQYPLSVTPANCFTIFLIYHSLPMSPLPFRWLWCQCSLPVYSSPPISHASLLDIYHFPSFIIFLYLQHHYLCPHDVYLSLPLNCLALFHALVYPPYISLPSTSVPVFTLSINLYSFPLSVVCQPFNIFITYSNLLIHPSLYPCFPSSISHHHSFTLSQSYHCHHFLHVSLFPYPSTSPTKSLPNFTYAFAILFTSFPSSSHVHASVPFPSCVACPPPPFPCFIHLLFTALHFSQLMEKLSLPHIPLFSPHLFFTRIVVLLSGPMPLLSFTSSLFQPHSLYIQYPFWPAIPLAMTLICEFT